VAVATSANQIVASSFSSLLTHLRRRTVDVWMGTILLIGGLLGSALGVMVFNTLKAQGQVDLLVRLSYVVFLGGVGGLMLWESLRASWRARGGAPATQRRRQGWMAPLPFKSRFRVSGLYISVIPPLGVGLLVGILSGIMGVGGGFILIPAMIYLLGMPTKVVIGTSTFQIIFLTAFTTLLHAVTNQTVDVVLALLLIVGGVIGAQFGARIGTKMRPEHLRLLLALLVLGVGGQIALDLLLRPDELFSFEAGG
jgi:hypothetical protein